LIIRDDMMQLASEKEPLASFAKLSTRMPSHASVSGYQEEWEEEGDDWQEEALSVGCDSTR
jgi:hypothetical protein